MAISAKAVQRATGHIGEAGNESSNPFSVSHTNEQSQATASIPPFQLKKIDKAAQLQAAEKETTPVSTPIVQRVPAPPIGATQNGLFYLTQPMNLNRAYMYHKIRDVQMVSAVPLTQTRLELYNPTDQLVWSQNNQEVFAFVSDILWDHPAGTYTLRGLATTQAGTQLYYDTTIQIFNQAPAGGTFIAAPINGSTYLGSHWTALDHVPSFKNQGIQERGESQVRFGEGLYLTGDRGYGWKAGYSKTEELGGSPFVAEIGVFLRPGQTLSIINASQIPENDQFTNPPWRGTSRERYITGYDAIFDEAEQELKINLQAFGKINVVHFTDYSALDPTARLQAIAGSRVFRG
ncbi:hypothetical protein [Chitinophaga polysaccharea]|uniref:hypothetical protein n=1 Tax=Chitinophaga polysaccharea TaxID=1293035 RepID=UPI001157FD8B|nr:hypothetical protein [Chitinophaga polysaccharea]